VSAGAGPWWKQAFRRPYLECYAHRSDGSAELEAEFVASLLGLSAGSRLLDAGCGAGRHARAFARRGARVVGLDLSADLLAEARRREPAAALVRADLRRLPFRAAAFAHAVSLFTAFGYFDDAGDRAQLGEIRRVLRAGGTLVLDFLNAPRVEATLVADSERRVGSRVFRERRRIREGRVEKDVEAPDGERWTESVRMYGRDELLSLLAGARFRVTSLHGDLAGGAWSESSERLVVAGEAA
jgi:ubiquinone/menaquinone biosynthesis C-methylase UbiE